MLLIYEGVAAVEGLDQVVVVQEVLDFVQVYFLEHLVALHVGHAEIEVAQEDSLLVVLDCHAAIP